MTQIARKDSVTQSIAIISAPSTKVIKPREAWYHGTNIRTAMRYEPKLTHISLMALLKDCVEYLDYNKTIVGTQHFIEAVDHLIEMFPAMKLEEWKVIMYRLKSGQYGKMYERLKLPEIVEAFKQYEGERGDMLHQDNDRLKDTPPEPMSEEQKNMFKKLKEDLNLPDAPKKHGRWKHIPYPNTDIEEYEKMLEERAKNWTPE